MSNVYTDLIYSEFPDKISTMARMQDVTSSAKPLVDQYFQYYNSGDFTNAKKVIDDNPELLTMLVNAKVFNQFRDEIIATQRLFKDDTENYIYTVVKNRGVWSNSNKYIKYNVVFYNNQPYMNIADDTPLSTPPTDINYWYPLSIKGNQGESGLGLTPRGSWNEYIQYYKDDLVSYNNALWACTNDNIGYFPNDDSNIWYCVLSINLVYDTMKIQNSEIDNIINGTATLTDGNTNISVDSNNSISKDEIDNVLNN